MITGFAIYAERDEDDISEAGGYIAGLGIALLGLSIIIVTTTDPWANSN